MASPGPPHALICELHGSLLRALASALDFHPQGLAQAARHMRRKALISNASAKKLVMLDNAYNVSRHITNVSAKHFFTSILDEVAKTNADTESSGCSGPEHGSDTTSVTSSTRCSSLAHPECYSATPAPTSLPVPTAPTEYYEMSDIYDIEPTPNFYDLDLSFARLAAAVDRFEANGNHRVVDALSVLPDAIGNELDERWSEVIHNTRRRVARTIHEFHEEAQYLVEEHGLQDEWDPPDYFETWDDDISAIVAEDEARLAALEHASPPPP